MKNRYNFKEKRIIGLLLAYFVLLAGFTESEQKIFTPGQVWLDNNNNHINAHGGGMLYVKDEGKYYWFGEHKTEGTKGNLAQVGVHCYSSEDLYNWKDEGIVLSVMPENSGSEIERGCIIERPKVIFNSKTKKYVMWFHLELKNKGYSNALSGVAISNKVTGPYTYLKSVRPNAGFWPLNYPDSLKEKEPKTQGIIFNGAQLPFPSNELNLVKRDFEKGQMARDMTLFVDEDDRLIIFILQKKTAPCILPYSMKVILNIPENISEFLLTVLWKHLQCLKEAENTT